MRTAVARIGAIAAVLAIGLTGCSATPSEPEPSTSAAEESPVDDLEIIDSSFEGPHGTVPIRIYRVAGTDPQDGLLWFHGGAFMFGDLDMPESHWVAQQLASPDRVVIAADYRLAPVPEGLGPEAPARDGYHFPIASEELAALAESLMTDDEFAETNDWVVGGASAGGTLASSVAMQLRDKAGVQPQGVLLAYPLLHAELPPIRAELMEKLAALPDAPGDPSIGVRDLNLHYVGGDRDQLANPYAFAGGHDLEGFPTTFIVNSDADPLRASGEMFGSELAADGVDVRVVREQDTVHGHINGPENPGAEVTIKRMKDWLAEIES